MNGLLLVKRRVMQPERNPTRYLPRNKEINSMYTKIIAYMEFRDSLLSEFFIICLRFFWIVRTPQEIIYGNIEIVSYAFK